MSTTGQGVLFTRNYRVPMPSILRNYSPLGYVELLSSNIEIVAFVTGDASDDLINLWCIYISNGNLGAYPPLKLEIIINLTNLKIWIDIIKGN